MINPTILKYLFYIILIILMIVPIFNISILYKHLDVLVPNLFLLILSIVLITLRYKNKANIIYIIIIILLHIISNCYNVYVSHLNTKSEVDISNPKSAYYLMVINIISIILYIVFLLMILHAKYSLTKARNQILNMGGTISTRKNIFSTPSNKIRSILYGNSPYNSYQLNDLNKVHPIN